MERHLAKYRKLVPSLALITHLANGRHGAIGIDAVSTALAWAKYLETHAARAYASVTMVELNAAKAIVAKSRAATCRRNSRCGKSCASAGRFSVKKTRWKKASTS